MSLNPNAFLSDDLGSQRELLGKGSGSGNECTANRTDSDSESVSASQQPSPRASMRDPLIDRLGPRVNLQFRHAVGKLVDHANQFHQQLNHSECV
jgi:hypothetical protein